jgi:dephospho-CoA kinase
MMKVGITGGIGSGKSTVCRLFAGRGVAVYDSDAAAKRLMGDALRPAVEARFGAAVYREGELDRARLAETVFRDPAALADLNAIVHPAVLRDFAAWAAEQPGDYVVLESAILFEAGLEEAVDRTVAVLAPLELRVARTCRRDGCDAEAVRRRIAAQADDDMLRDRADYTLVNISEAELDRRFRAEIRPHEDR